ncbi:ABC thiamine transporter, ATPase subunit [Roseobacter sp. SK209-2-6]|uniref:thiamine ABC transporter ATP-binding protein n=1 Tax=Roseobacter sp. SK209-2-6 TaxID=388739 RepID=UPI0000F3F43C|nr:ATP-binding cassette domain-containing protein [Roseobacter sp. SK209-2-6]EBA14654.1 ABC thiamine transporter, ATPase subunit [Roseobacter sp. SK209-2-6]
MLKIEAGLIDNGDFTISADFSLGAGDKAAIIGPSGAGKSTLIQALSGFLPLRQGRILWKGADLTPLLPGDRPTATLFQDGNLFPHLTAGQNAGLGLQPDLRLSKAQEERVGEALKRVGLEGLEDRKPSELSGGQQSRVALARVLLQRKEILLLDEPFAALGPALKADMLDLVSEIVTDTGATLLMVSHDPQDARRIADQGILVAEGRVHDPMPCAALLDNPPPSLKAYLG